VPAKDRARRRATWNAWYHRTKHLRVEDVPRQTAVKRARKQALAAWYAELKSKLVCTCGQDHPACLQFHHLDRTSKELSLAVAIHRGFGRARIMREIAKCIVLCANCHAKLHARERTDAEA
jgi:hypothetical protein